MLYLHFFCIFSMFISGRMHINNWLNARRILMNFFNVFISVKEGLGGVTNACICMGTHSHFFCIFSMFISGRMHINNWLNARRISMNFFNVFISVKEGLVGGGVTNACICMGTHSLSYRTDWWMLTKLGRDEVIMALHKRLGFSAKSAQRWIQVGVMFIVCA